MQKTVQPMTHVSVFPRIWRRALVGAASIWACAGGVASEQEKPTAASPNAFARYIQALDPRKPGVLREAATKFANDFARATQTERDSAFLSLHDLHNQQAEDRTALLLQRQVEALAGFAEDGSTAPMDRMRSTVVPELNASEDFRSNGLWAVYRGDGTWQVITNSAYICRPFMDTVSTGITEFLLMETRETSEPAVLDGAIIVSHGELGARFAAWDRLIAQAPDSPFRGRAEVFRQELRQAFLTGTGQSPLTLGNDRAIRPEVLSAWRAFVVQYPDRPSTATITQLVEAADAAGGNLTGEVNRLLGRAAMADLPTTPTVSPGGAAVLQELKFGPHEIRVVAADSDSTETRRAYAVEVKRDSGFTTRAVFRASPIVQAWAEDLDSDGNFEVLLWTRAEGVESTGSLNVFEFDGRVLALRPSPGIPEAARAGWRGQDQFRIDAGAVVRDFPVYNPGDPRERPSGGHREIVYRFAGDSWKAEPAVTVVQAFRYFPLAPGATWHYVTAADAELSQTVTRQGAGQRFQLCELPGGTASLIEIRPREVVRIAAEAAATGCDTDITGAVGFAEVLLRDPVTTGAAWESMGVRSEVATVGMTLETSGQTYEDVTAVVRGGQTPGDATTRTDFYAPGVGLVLSRTQDQTGISERRLTSADGGQ